DRRHRPALWSLANPRRFGASFEQDRCRAMPAKPASRRSASVASARKRASRPAAKATPRPAAKSAGKAAALPEWNLADLYPSIRAPEVTRDLDRLDADCIAFEQTYKGKLAERTAAEGGGAWLAEAVRRYEAIDDL